MHDILFCLILISRLELWRVTEENAAPSVGGLLHPNSEKMTDSEEEVYTFINLCLCKDL